MSFNLNEKCLLNYLCKFQGYPSEQVEVKSNLVNLLEDFGVVIHPKNNGYTNQIYEIIESYEKV